MLGNHLWLVELLLLLLLELLLLSKGVYCLLRELLIGESSLFMLISHR